MQYNSTNLLKGKRIIVPGITDSLLVRHVPSSSGMLRGPGRAPLLKKQVRSYESTHALLHAKTAVIDGIWSTVGTSNLDYRGFLHNDEISAVVLGRSFGRRMEEQFRKDIELCRPVGLENWRRRPFLDRLIERLSRASNTGYDNGFESTVSVALNRMRMKEIRPLAFFLQRLAHDGAGNLSWLLLNKIRP